MEIKQKLEAEMVDVPQGTLRIAKKNKCVQYYHCLPGEKSSGRYIRNQDHETAVRLAQKTYDEKVLKLVRRRLFQIAQILKDYQDDEIEQVFLSEHPERQKLVAPIEPTCQQRLDEWIFQPFMGKGFKEDAPIILTNKGIRVRSKSEKIMADYFDTRGIRYKYECPLYLKPYGIIYPDFTFMSRQTGKTIYWEHEGMMDNPDYARNAVQKIELYESNNIFPGEQLILTFETSVSSINTILMKELTEKYLL